MTAPDLRPYLTSLITDPTSQGWGNLYTPTQAELPLQVQTVGALQSKTQPQLQPEKVPERLDVLVGLRQYAPDHVVLVGKPGSGKSTALRRLLWETAQTALAAIENGETDCQIPILIELRNCRNGSVLDWIQQSSRRLRLSREAIEDWLLAGRFFLLFDGVNELPTAEAWSILNQFRNDADFCSNSMIFTARQLEAGTELGVEKKLEMLPLTKPQIQEFVHKQLGENANALLQQFQGRLWELAETPLLLQMLCQVFAQSPSGQLPHNRGELFQQFSQQYDRFKPLRGLVSEDSRRLIPILLEQLAFEMMQGQSPTEMDLQITRADAVRKLQAFLHSQGETDPLTKATEYLEDLLEWHLLQFTADQQEIEFHHQLFQEYYAAKSLLKQLPQPINQQFKHDYLNYLKWTESIALMLSLIKDKAQAIRVVKLALEVDLMLGARLAGEVRAEFQQDATSLITQLELPQLFKIELLGRTRSDLVIPQLLPFLSDEDFDTRYVVAQAFGRIGSEAVLAALLPFLQNQNPSVCLAVIKSLEQIPDEQVVLELLANIETSSPDVRRSIVSALGSIKNKIAVDALLKTLDDDQASVRSEAALALGKIGDSKAVPRLIQALSDNGFWVAESAAYALGEIGSPDTITPLIQTLKSTKIFSVSEAVSEAIKKLPAELVLPYLVKILDDKDPSVQVSGIHLAAGLNNQAIVPKLLELLNRRSERLRSPLVFALGELKVSEVKKIQKTLFEEQPSVRARAVTALGMLKAEEAIPELTAALEDNYWLVQANATFALAQIGTETALQGLFLALKHSDPRVRSNAVSAVSLGVFEKIQFISELLIALTDSDQWVRAYAAEALGEIGTQAAITGALSALQDPEPSVRRGAIRGLRKIIEVQVADEISKALTDQDRYVRQEAAYAIAETEYPKFLGNLTDLLKTTGEIYFLNATSILQGNCQFYNHTIEQLVIEPNKGTGLEIQSVTQNFFIMEPVGILNTGNVTNNNQIGVQHVPAISDTTTIDHQNSP